MISPLTANSSLNLIVLASEQCNFRCSYCYEKFLRYNIDPEVLDSLAALIKRRLPSLEYLHIGWFGGEPLLNVGAISKLSDSIKNSNVNNARISSTISTNGYLLSPRVVENLYGWYVKNYQISIDGSEKHHNETRKTRRGAGSFSKVMDAIKNIKNFGASDISVRLRVHVTTENSTDMDELFSVLSESLSSDNRFSIHIKAVENLGGKIRENFSFVNRKETVQEIKSSAEGFGLIVVDESKESICYAALPNAFVIRTDGVVQKCTVALDSDRNSIGKIRPDGLSIDGNKHFEWLKPLIEGDTAGMQCPARNVLKFGGDA